MSKKVNVAKVEVTTGQVKEIGVVVGEDAVYAKNNLVMITARTGRRMGGLTYYTPSDSHYPPLTVGKRLPDPVWLMEAYESAAH